MSDKKKVREKFRTSVFARDGHRCKVCGWKPTPEEGLDAHHVTDRNLMPGGGYVASNGISLCPECHLRAEEYHTTGTASPGFAPKDLYAKIGSSFEQAVKDSQRLVK